MRDHSRGPVCQVCGRRAVCAFLVDSTGIVYHPVVLDQRVLITLVGCLEADFPDGSKYTQDPEHRWACEVCVLEVVDGE